MDRLEKKIGYSFKNRTLLMDAMTHSSYTGSAVNNERLEYLGDAVLELIISAYLYTTNTLSEGKMTKIRSNIVCAESLAIAAAELDLGTYIMLGKGEQVTGGRNRRSNLANAFEALLGAVFLDSDYETAREVVLRLLDKNIAMSLEGTLVKDYKTELQERIQKDSDCSIEYTLSHSEGPEHDKTFYTELMFDKQKVSEGVGKSKKESEQDAARNYLRQNRQAI